MATYTGTNLKDLDTTTGGTGTPIEGNAPSELNDAIREIKRVLKSHYAISTITATYTATATDEVILYNAASGTINLPQQSTVSSSSVFKRYTIIKVSASAGTVTIDPYSTETINGVTTYALTNQYDYISVVGNGETNWKIFEGSVSDFGNANATTYIALANSAAFADAHVTTQIAFTPKYTGKYKITFTFIARINGTLGAAVDKYVTFTLNNGSDLLIEKVVGISNPNAAPANTQHIIDYLTQLISIDTLTGGTSYVYKLRYKTNGYASELGQQALIISTNNPCHMTYERV